MNEYYFNKISWNRNTFNYRIIINKGIFNNYFKEANVKHYQCVSGHIKYIYF